MADADWELCRARFAAGSVCPSTQEQYTSMLNKIMRARHPDGTRNLRPNLSDYTVFLSMQANQGLAPDYVDRIQTAVMYGYSLVGQWPRQGLIAYAGRVIEGYKRANPVVIKPRGAITAAMFDQVLGMLAKEQYARKEVATGLCFAFGFGFRGGQIRTLRRGEFHPADGTWLYLGMRHKVKNAGSPTVGVEMHDLAPQLCPFVSAYLPSVDDPDTLLFPHYDAREAGRIIKRAAATNGWDSSERWDGGHCVRHGSLHDARLAGGRAAVQARGAHKTTAMQDHYSCSNEDRVAAARAQTAKAFAAQGAQAANKKIDTLAAALVSNRVGKKQP